jgi:hypothetical protein
MTSSISLSNGSSAANTDANCNQTPAFSGEKPNAALPRPSRSLPSIADSGRISFGAGYRLPVKK